MGFLVCSQLKQSVVTGRDQGFAINDLPQKLPVAGLEGMIRAHLIPASALPQAAESALARV